MARNLVRANVILAVLALIVAFTGVASAEARSTKSQRPSVSKLSVSHGASSGGTVITVLGKNFTRSTVVRFGSAKAKRVHVLGPTKLRVVAPNHKAGTVYLSVKTAHGSSVTTKRSRFTFVSPARVLPGANIPAPQPSPTASPSPTPPIHQFPRPKILAISPASGHSGDTVTITGYNFVPGETIVLFGGTPWVCSDPTFPTSTGLPCPIPGETSTSIVVQVPPHAAGPVDVSVSSVLGTDVLVNGFTYVG
jgi:hypothetical protein